MIDLKNSINNLIDKKNTYSRIRRENKILKDKISYIEMLDRQSETIEDNKIKTKISNSLSDLKDSMTKNIDIKQQLKNKKNNLLEKRKNVEYKIISLSTVFTKIDDMFQQEIYNANIKKSSCCFSEFMLCFYSDYIDPRQIDRMLNEILTNSDYENTDYNVNEGNDDYV